MIKNHPETLYCWFAKRNDNDKCFELEKYPSEKPWGNTPRKRMCFLTALSPLRIELGLEEQLYNIVLVQYFILSLLYGAYSYSEMLCILYLF